MESTLNLRGKFVYLDSVAHTHVSLFSNNKRGVFFRQHEPKAVYNFDAALFRFGVVFDI